MKKTMTVTIALSLMLMLVGCQCAHDWKNATCIEPKICEVCGETSGSPTGHTWINATCTEPKICETCGEKAGEKLGHSWANASCVLPKTCTICNLTDGVALGHLWIDATCTTPKTCETCKITEGDPLGHDATGLTCTNSTNCSHCNTLIPAPGHKLSEATCTEPAKCTVCGEASGSALGHTTESGTCERCGLEAFKTVNGRGDDVISNITIGNGIYRVHFTHSGRRNFIVWCYDSTNDRELLINEIGRYEGYVLLSGSDPFIFEITADGSWSYTIERLDKTIDTSFAGKGDYVTGLCSLSSGVWEFSHDGKSNFAVWIYTSNDRDLLVNEIGKYNGKKVVTIPTGSYAFFEITADGNWTIKKA